MAELTTLARPYAKAAFDYAKEHNAINEWESFLSVASNVVQDSSFVALLNNPAITVLQKTVILMDICNPAGESTPMSELLNTVQLPAGEQINALVQQVSMNSNPTNRALTNFITQLAENERLALLPEILSHFGRFKSEELKQVDAYITSAYALTDDERKLLQERLAVATNSIVILHEEVDSSLIGGATIKIGDKFTDGSVRGKLKQLKTQLTA
ncbi:MAG: F0F1 ATP synthase subunit delta [Moraxella sp.]|nr:F0F1 ATP synthase subunit delta [Moraxella sp.]